MQHGAIGLLSGFGIVVVCYLIACYAIAASRKGRVGVTVTTQRHDVFVPIDPATVFARLAQIGDRYRVDDVDPVTRRLVLSSSVTLFTWGYFYPVAIHPHGPAGSRIEIGIRSRLPQRGALMTALVTHALLRCADEISEWLEVPAARVA
jgi:hypothetical protein